LRPCGCSLEPGLICGPRANEGEKKKGGGEGEKIEEGPKEKSIGQIVAQEAKAERESWRPDSHRKS